MIKNEVVTKWKYLGLKSKNKTLIDFIKHFLLKFNTV